MAKLSEAFNYFHPRTHNVLIAMVACLYAIKQRAKQTHSDINNLGAFLPALNEETRIFVRSGRCGEQEAAVISHEHIHLLQHRSAVSSKGELKQPGAVLTEKYLAIPHGLYLLRCQEVEARLHELILSFYRENRQLPVTVADFLELLACTQGFDWLKETLEWEGACISGKFRVFSVRDPMIAKQLELILLAVKFELIGRFCTEVLTVMYGNLLRYYGEDDATKQYFAEIERPNLFDELYPGG